MPTFEVTVPDQIDSQLDRLVDQGDFLNREQAIEELLTMGVSAYDVPEDSTQEVGEELFTRAVDDQQDPAQLDDQRDDGYTF
ncbi:ribbon-helix-helix domain-containing protein [Halomarina pelagica]|uniref:ribbon-helix-helix domain-containing protein n=1 Tax=Halomarina pelagica TaxID=2961599 RepID=UPI0020C5592C|nr:CopG family transcriptional regulator [Halomarina sp. BND7]